MTDEIRLLIADDQALVRGALAALLDLEPDLRVVAQVGRGDEVVDAATEVASSFTARGVVGVGREGGQGQGGSEDCQASHASPLQ